MLEYRVRYFTLLYFVICAEDQDRSRLMIQVKVRRYLQHKVLTLADTSFFLLLSIIIIIIIIML